jgi:hypothetical protein
MVRPAASNPAACRSAPNLSRMPTVRRQANASRTSVKNSTNQRAANGHDGPWTSPPPHAEPSTSGSEKPLTASDPVVGDLDLNYEGLNLTADPGLLLLAYTAEPGSPSHERLQLLASWAATSDEAGSASPVPIDATDGA